MEAELLRNMITDRDKRIEKIKQKSEDLRLRAVVLSEQLEHVGADVTQQTKTFSEESAELLRIKGEVVERLERTQKDFKQQGVSLQTYSRDTVQDGSDASYVMRMQAQLCKAMHSLGITDHQMDLAEKHAEADIKFHREILAKCMDERTATELELMNQLIVKDNERRDIEAVYTTQLDKIAKEREALERQIEENGGDEEDDDENDDGDDEEEDEEEKEIKEELMRLLTERRAEIERLEQLQEDQEELIAELEDQVGDDGPSTGPVSSSRADDDDDDGDADAQDDDVENDEEGDADPYDTNKEINDENQEEDDIERVDDDAPQDATNEDLADDKQEKDDNYEENKDDEDER
jgi:hypothetical protein